MPWDYIERDRSDRDSTTSARSSLYVLAPLWAVSALWWAGLIGFGLWIAKLSNEWDQAWGVSNRAHADLFPCMQSLNETSCLYADSDLPSRQRRFCAWCLNASYHGCMDRSNCNNNSTLEDCFGQVSVDLTVCNGRPTDWRDRLAAALFSLWLVLMCVVSACAVSLEDRQTCAATGCYALTVLSVAFALSWIEYSGILGSPWIVTPLAGLGPALCILVLLGIVDVVWPVLREPRVSAFERNLFRITLFTALSVVAISVVRAATIHPFRLDNLVVSFAIALFWCLTFVAISFLRTHLADGGTPSAAVDNRYVLLVRFVDQLYFVFLHLHLTLQVLFCVAWTVGHLLIAAVVNDHSNCWVALSSLPAPSTLLLEVRSFWFSCPLQASLSFSPTFCCAKTHVLVSASGFSR